MPTNSQVQIFNPENHPSLAPTFSQISIVPISPTASLVSFAGQVGFDLSTDRANPPTYQQQVRAALANVDKCLVATGCSKADIVSIRQYVVKLTSLLPEDRQAQTSIFLDWWRGTEGERLLPPDTLIGVDSLFGKEALFEMEVTAIKVTG